MSEESDQAAAVARIEQKLDSFIESNTKEKKRDREEVSELKKRVDNIEPKVQDNTLISKVGKSFLYVLSLVGLTFVFDYFSKLIDK